MKEMLENDIIEASSSSWNSPIWVVPRKGLDKDGSKCWRIVLDYRRLNDKVLAHNYLIPLIRNIFDQLAGAKYFSVFDCVNGYHQILLNPEHKHKTAFSANFSKYQFKRLPFGLSNSPATFQRLMDTIFTDLQGKSIFIFMDNLVIFSKTLEEHREKYLEIVKRLRNAKIKFGPDKCTFLKREALY